MPGRLRLLAFRPPSTRCNPARLLRERTYTVVNGRVAMAYAGSDPSLG